MMLQLLSNMSTAKTTMMMLQRHAQRRTGFALAGSPSSSYSQLSTRHHMHTFLHRRSHLHTQAGAAVARTLRSQARPMSYSAIPRIIFRRIPVVFLGGTAAGGAYVVSKVEAARNSLFESANNAAGAVGDALNQVGDALGLAGNKMGEGVDDLREFSSGVWGSVRAFMGDLSDRLTRGDGEESNGSGSGHSGGSDGKPPLPTPERIAKAAAIASTLPIVMHPDNHDNDTDQATNDLMMLTKKLIEIRSILLSIDHGESLQLPAIVVIGSQSSGKSSVLEAIVGREFLPKGNNMVTRRPIELTLIHTPASASDPRPKTFAELPNFAPGQRFTDFELVQKMLYDLNMSVPAEQAVSSVPIELRIHSPHVPDLSLVDLPGYIEISSMDQPDTLKEEITNLVEKYIKPPNILLAVCAADVDLANSPALRASRRVDPLGMRTIGVVTKMDLVEPKHGADILTGKRYPLSLGYVGVVCKAAAKSREGKSLIKVDHAEDEGIAGVVRRQEQAYFTSHAEFFSKEGVQVTTDLLKKRLMHVLEESMANSLHTISNNVAIELEESRYQFKVQYNDRTVSPESYLAETLDQLKHRLNAFSKAYTKSQVRKMLKTALENQAMDVLADYYWRDGSDKDSMEDLAGLQAKADELRAKIARNPELAKAQPDPELVWRHKLEAATSALTKSGVGRTSTQLVVDAIRAHISNTLTTEEPLVNHPSASERINSFSDAILRDRYTITAEQVENCIKPYKYEVELDPEGKEWDKGRLDSIQLVQREIEMCDNALNAIRDSVGGSRRLKGAMQYVQDLEDREKQRVAALRAAAAKRLGSEESQISDDLIIEDQQDPSKPVYNPTLLVKAREARFLQGRTALLKARINALKSKQCRTYNEKTADRIRVYCPEAFLSVVADKLASTAVMFINIELLAEYFYLFPREIETRLGYDLNHSEILAFARENPRFRKHLDLQERKEKLELVMEKLDALTRLQQERQGPIRGAPSRGSNRRFGLF